MGIFSTAMKLLMDAGVTGDALVTAIEKLEATQEKTRTSHALRQERYRERHMLRHSDAMGNKSVTSDVTGVTSDDAHTTEVSKKEKKVSKGSGARFALTHLPPEWKSFCLEKRPDLSPEETFDRFSDWWAAAPGGKGLKADWYATWRNWVRDQKSKGVNGNGGNSHGNPTKQDRFKAAFESARADIIAEHARRGSEN